MLEISSVSNASDRLLMILKMRGPQTLAEIAKTLGVTGEAVRQQLAKLNDEELIVNVQERHGVGRPRQVWRLSDAGEARFPDRHALVTIQLIDEIRSQFGQKALDRVIDERGAKVKQTYLEQMQHTHTLKEKVAKLAEIRTREGYMAEWQQEPDGTFLFLENHCPICAAARMCQGFCKAEFETFHEVLGGSSISIERIEHIVCGARRCVYRIISSKSKKNTLQQPPKLPARGNSQTASRRSANPREYPSLATNNRRRTVV